MLGTSRMATPLVVILCGLLQARAIADGPPERGVITSLGTYKLFQDKLTVKVAEEKGTLTFQLARAIKDGSVTDTLHPGVKLAGTVWAVFPESADKVWVFYDSYLYRWEFEATALGHNSSSKVFFGDNAVKNAPEALLKVLPKEHVEKLKGK